MHTEEGGASPAWEPESSACKTPTETSLRLLNPNPTPLQTPDKCTYRVSSGALGEVSSGLDLDRQDGALAG